MNEILLAPSKRYWHMRSSQPNLTIYFTYQLTDQAAQQVTPAGLDLATLGLQVVGAALHHPRCTKSHCASPVGQKTQCNQKLATSPPSPHLAVNGKILLVNVSVFPIAPPALAIVFMYKLIVQRVHNTHLLRFYTNNYSRIRRAKSAEDVYL